MKMSLDLMSQRKDLPDDLACFLQQQKQRQARLETTMRSFPSRGDMDIEKMEAKKKKNIHEVSESPSDLTRDVETAKVINSNQKVKSEDNCCNLMVSGLRSPPSKVHCSDYVMHMFSVYKSYRNPQLITNSRKGSLVSEQYNRNDLILIL